MTKLSYVIPCYRSAKTITGVVEEIAQTVAGMPGYEHEVILVNDNSPDGTWPVLRGLAQEHDNITAVNLARNFGQHAALMAGFHQVTGDIIICLDDDGQTPACESPSLIAAIEEGHDVVYAAYDTKKQSGFRNLGSAINSKMTEWCLGKPEDLVINSYFAAKRFIIDEMTRYNNCYPYVIGLVLRATNNVCNVQVKHRARENGSSGYTIGKLLSLWMNGFTSFSVKPLRMATYAGFISSALGVLYLLYIIIHHFLEPGVPLGWSSMMVVMLLLGGLVLVGLGIIGEYVGRIYMCVNSAPQFVIRDVVSPGRGEDVCRKDA